MIAFTLGAGAGVAVPCVVASLSSTTDDFAHMTMCWSAVSCVGSFLIHAKIDKAHTEYKASRKYAERNMICNKGGPDLSLEKMGVGFFGAAFWSSLVTGIIAGNNAEANELQSDFNKNAAEHSYVEIVETRPDIRAFENPVLVIAEDGTYEVSDMSREITAEQDNAPIVPAMALDLG